MMMDGIPRTTALLSIAISILWLAGVIAIGWTQEELGTPPITTFTARTASFSSSTLEQQHKSSMILQMRDDDDDATSSKTCTWGLFSNESQLTKTQVIANPMPWQHHGCSSSGGNLLRCQAKAIIDASHGSLFVHPPSKFAFCLIEKNSCYQWSAIFNMVLKNKTTAVGVNYFVAKQSIERYGTNGVEQVFSDPTATRAVVVRDPLARFASAYLNKCFTNNCTNQLCLPRTQHPQRSSTITFQKGEPIPFRQALLWMLRSDPANVDGHWKLQSEHCDLKNRIQEYTIVGLMTKETLYQDATCIMRQAGLDRFNVRDNVDEPFWAQKAAVNKQREESEIDVLKKLFMPDAARELMTKLHQDYETFHLPEPTWIDQATGEWMDATDHHRCDTNGFR